MKHKDLANLLIEQLEYFRERPMLFIRPVDVSHVEAFLQGVDVALVACGINLDHAVVGKSHGFEEHPLTIGHRMQTQGMAPEIIVTELIDLMVDALHRVPDDDGRSNEDIPAPSRSANTEPHRP